MNRCHPAPPGPQPRNRSCETPGGQVQEYVPAAVQTARDRSVAAATNAVVANSVLTSPAAGVGALGIPVNVGEASGAAPGSFTATNGAPAAMLIIAVVIDVAPGGTAICQSGTLPLAAAFPALTDRATRC